MFKLRPSELAANLALSATAIFVTLVVLEVVVFRMILPPDDVIENATIDGVVRYRPETSATFRHPDGRTTQLTINKDGWNSTIPAYATQKTAGDRKSVV